MTKKEETIVITEPIIVDDAMITPDALARADHVRYLSDHTVAVPTEVVALLLHNAAEYDREGGEHARALPW